MLVRLGNLLKRLFPVPPDVHPFECEVIETFTNEYRVRRRGGQSWLGSSRVAVGARAYYSMDWVFREEIESRSRYYGGTFEQYYFNDNYNARVFKTLDEAISMAKRAEEGLKEAHEREVARQARIRAEQAEARARASYVQTKVWR